MGKPSRDSECSVVCDPITGCREVCDRPKDTDYYHWIGGGLILGGTIATVCALLCVAILEVSLGMFIFLIGNLFLNPLFYSVLGVILGAVTIVGGFFTTRDRGKGTMIALGSSALTVVVMVIYIFVSDPGFVALLGFYITALVGGGISLVGSVLLMLNIRAK